MAGFEQDFFDKARDIFINKKFDFAH